MKTFTGITIALTMLVTVACGTVGYNRSVAKPIVSLSGFVAASGLVQQGEQCLYVVNYHNGKSTQVKLDSTVCQEASVAILQANAQKATADAEAARRAAALDAKKD